VAGPFEAYRQVFGVTDLEDQLFSLTRAYVTSIAGRPLPIVLQHRDFTVWNIARNGRELAVLDWEGTRPGPALCDLLHFVAHWYDTVHHAYDEAARQRCFRRLLFEPVHGDPFRKPVHDMIAGYMDRLGMDRRFLPLLLVYTWVELALRRADQQRLQEEPHSDSRVSNRYRAFVAILAQHAEQLFSDLPGGAARERR
jgi:aminoglycoside phosphotransferase (APT) family kinase protein